MVTRAALAWLVLLALAIANGAARETFLTPRFGVPLGHAISTMVLSVLIFIVGSLVMPWIGPATVREGWVIGTIWVALTIGFEFLGGHFIFGRPWQVLVADYNVFAGRIWVVVLIVTLLTPVLSFKTHALADVPAPAAQHR